MSWNYRVMRKYKEDESFEYCIVETYYKETGEVDGWTRMPSYPRGESYAEFKSDLDMYLIATTKDILDEKELLDKEQN